MQPTLLLRVMAELGWFFSHYLLDLVTSCSSGGHFLFMGKAGRFGKQGVVHGRSNS